MLEELTSLVNSPLGIWESIIRVLFALVASAAVYLMYQVFYGSRNIGAGVNRTFLIGGPAIAMIFLIIQTSIPLGLGLMGALSFVRFRTPIKDPAEIGFLLLLIAAAIGTATGNIMPTLVFLLIIFAVLGGQRLISSKASTAGRGHLLISVDKASFPGVEKTLSAYLSEQLRGLSLDTMSTMEDRVSLQYQYQKKAGFDWTSFTSEINRLSGSAKVEIFIS